jgi:tetratricopeptide (TPR) repeat protein
MSEKALHRLLALVIFLIPLVVYLLTMAPSLVFWDSGEFIATAHILGIAHSPGTPLFTLVGRVFSILPVPLNAAARVNLFSVLCGAFAVLMGYLIAVRTLRFMYPSMEGALERFMMYAGPFVGALYFTFSHTHWLDSTETEVYALNAFVMGLCTLLAIEWYENPTGRPDRRGMNGADAAALVEEERLGRARSQGLVYLIIYLLALGIGFHLGTVLVYGGIFLLFLLVREKIFSNVELIIYSFGFAVLLGDMTLYKSSGVTIAGLLIFAVLVAWSTVRKGRFALVATGLLALGISVHLYMYIRAHLHPAINMIDPETWKAMHYHIRREQYPVSNMFVRKAPLFWQFKYFGGYFRDQFRMIGDVRIGIFNLGQALTAIPVALGLLGMAANFNRERKLWVLNFTNFLVNSLGLIIFLNFTANEVRDRDYFFGGAFFFFSVFIAIGVTSFLVSVAEYFRNRGRPAAYVVPIGALCIFLSILPAHYNWFTHNRSHYYIAEDYAHNMLAQLEPGAIIFTGGDNDTYPLWYIQNVENYRTDVRVIVLTLLNTDWYIKQLRDEEPKVPITLTDDEIERMRPIALKDGGVAWNDDLMIQHIIQTVDWKRPIYFATSVQPVKWKPYKRYLETRGLAMRLIPDQGDRMINVFMIRRNFEEIFRFRGILTKDWEVDNSLYHEKDLNVTLNNYGVAAAELGNALGRQKDYAGAVKWTKIALLFAPRLKPVNIMLGTYYFMNGQRSEAVAHYRQMTQVDPLEAEYWMRLAWIYSQDDPDLARRTIDEALAHIPDDRQLYIEGFRYAVRMGLADVAKGYIQRWLERHPDDREMRGVYGDVDSLIRVNAKHPPAGDTGRTGG